jgi:hypothetical protein
MHAIYMSITRETRVDVLTAVSFLLACLLQFLEAAKDSDSGALDRVMASYGKHLLKISVLQSCIGKVCYFPCHGLEALCISEYLILCYAGEEVVAAVGSEIDRLEKEIQRIVPAILHVDIEAHNPNGPVPREKFYLYRYLHFLVTSLLLCCPCT